RDWSSDVCSSDLRLLVLLVHVPHGNPCRRQPAARYRPLSTRVAVAWRPPRTTEGLPPGATALPICFLISALTAAQEVSPTGYSSEVPSWSRKGLRSLSFGDSDITRDADWVTGSRW